MAFVGDFYVQATCAACKHSVLVSVLCEHY